MSFKLTWRSHVICVFISIILLAIFNPFYESILLDLSNQNIINYPTSNLIVNFYIFTIILMIPISIIHEGIHGIAYRLFGGKVKYGFKGIYAYTSEISSKEIFRWQFLIILLSPLTMISIMSVFLPPWLGGMIYLLNLIGASGDIYMALYLYKFSYKSRIVDRPYGFDVIE